MIYHKTLKHQKFLFNFAKEMSQFEFNGEIFKKIIDISLENIKNEYEPIFHLKLMSQVFRELQDYKIYIPENIVSVLIEKLKSIINRSQLHNN